MVVNLRPSSVIKFQQYDDKSMLRMVGVCMVSLRMNNSTVQAPDKPDSKLHQEKLKLHSIL